MARIIEKDVTIVASHSALWHLLNDPQAVFEEGASIVVLPDWYYHEGKVRPEQFAAIVSQAKKKPSST